MSILEISTVGIIVFGAALIQGGIGFGYSVMVIPLLRLIDPSLTPIPQIFLALTLAVAAAWRERSSLVTTNMGWLMAGRIPGSIIGAWILTVVAVSTLDIIIALVVLAGITIVAWRQPWEARPTICLVTGVASGIMGTTSAMSGPPVALLYQGNERDEARASLGAIFAVGGVVSVVVLSLAGVVSFDHLQIAGALALPTWLGFGVSSHFIRYLDERLLRRGVFVVSSVASVVLLTRGIVG